ncbi:beta-L-arabinofuranosidase domain-containing protein [Jiangella muralis]|uniref:beta-L-arabinofuranosidase domain-containing protein n=1 Tax=Jiangella muralis TaxID=702383 RepID=UPI0009F8C901|nr:beta-L-arabinofuranosidase domain-containing protein [Jiangella muralis]
MSKRFSRRDALRFGAMAAAAPAAASAVATAAAPAAAAPAPAAAPAIPGGTPRPGWTSAGWEVAPFALNQVSLGDGIYKAKRDRMIDYARHYPGTSDPLDGPDRMLHLFRANAGLPAPGTWPGGWDTPNHLLRGHFSGHWMTMLAQCWAATGEEIFLTKLDYIVEELAKVQDALDGRNVGRVPGRFGNAVKLGDPHPNQFVTLPTGLTTGLTDATFSAWVSPGSSQTNARILTLATSTRAYLALTARVSNDVGPRFAITVDGANAEQRIDSATQLTLNTWNHVAVTLQGSTGRLYVNGVEAGVNTAMTITPAALGDTVSNWIGRSTSNDHVLLNAAVDEVQLHGRALSAAEIQQLATEPTGVDAGALRARWTFDDEGETAPDASGNGRPATIVGTGYPGYLAAFPEGQFIRIEPPMVQPNSGPNAVWAVWYTHHKIMRGLLNAYDLTGNEDALPILLRMGEWVHSRLSRISPEGRDQMWNTYSAGEAGSMNEVMAELAAHTTDAGQRARFLETAKLFTFSTLFTASIENSDQLNGRHANQYMAPNIGYLRIFEQTGEERFHTAARNFWGMVVPHRTFSNGGAGRSEHFRARGDITSGFTSGSDPRHAETCCAYNMLRLTRNLFFHEPEPTLMDFYERALHNQILSSRRDVDSVTATEVTYHQNMWPGRSRRIGTFVEYSRYGGNGSCCNGTGVESHTKYQETVFLRSGDGSALYLNLFIQATLTWPERGFVITQETAFPAAGSTRLRFVSGSGPLDLKLRVPGWAWHGYTVAVNGRDQQVDATPSSYVTVSRSWQAGDVVDINMPLSFWVDKAANDKSIQSIMYGPTLMVVRDDTPSYREFTFFPQLGLDGDLAASIQPADASMHFTTHGYLLAPYYVADPVPGQFNSFHPYVKRVEPEVVFRSQPTGVPNDAIRDQNGETFLDRVWDAAPFAGHGDLVRRVEAVSAEWFEAGRHNRQQRQAILVAAARSQSEF